MGRVLKFWGGKQLTEPKFLDAFVSMNQRLSPFRGAAVGWMPDDSLRSFRKTVYPALCSRAHDATSLDLSKQITERTGVDMPDIQMWLPLTGAGSFGAVVGWMTHHTYTASREMTVKSLGAIIGVIGGGAVTAIFQDKLLFGAYCIGLCVAFFVRVVAAKIGNALDEEIQDQRKRADARRAQKSAAKLAAPPTVK